MSTKNGKSSKAHLKQVINYQIGIGGQQNLLDIHIHRQRAIHRFDNRLAE